MVWNGEIAITKRCPVVKITTKTIFWFTFEGKITLERPPARTEAKPFRLEELQEGKKIRHVTGWRCCDQFAIGIQLLLDEAGRIIVERFDDLERQLTPRGRKPRVIASSLEGLAKQFGGVYDALFYVS